MDYSRGILWCNEIFLILLIENDIARCIEIFGFKINLNFLAITQSKSFFSVNQPLYHFTFLFFVPAHQSIFMHRYRNATVASTDLEQYIRDDFTISLRHIR